MAHATHSDYYTSQEAKLLKRFDRVFRRVSQSLERRYDSSFARAVTAASRDGFSAILPQLPYVGGADNLFTPIIVINGWFIPFHRVMKARGRSVEDVVRIGCEVADSYFRSMPRLLLRAARELAFGFPSKWVLEKGAARSQKREFAADWVFTVVEGDGEHFDYGLELTECAVVKLYEAQNVEELKPFCNFFDVTYSRYMGLGIDASSTLGLGCETCRLLYKKGGETRIPPRLQGLMPPL